MFWLLIGLNGLVIVGFFTVWMWQDEQYHKRWKQRREEEIQWRLDHGELDEVGARFLRGDR